MSFVRKAGEREAIEKEGAQGGPGTMRAHKLINQDEELLNKGRLFNDIVLEKGCGVGYHQHVGDAELYYIMSGEAQYNDNGSIVTLHPGDLTFTGPGEYHGITNEKEEPLRFIALVVYE